MSEQLTVLFEQLRGSQPPAPFAPPDQVRRRGRQRNHRQALAAGTAVLAAAGLGTGWALGTAGEPTPPPATSPPPQSSSPWLSPSPLPSPSPAPSRTPTLGPGAVPASALLTPADFAAVASVQTRELDDQGPDGPEWPWVMRDCPQYRAADYPSVPTRRDARGLGYLAEPWDAWEIIERYPDAAANMADVRKALATCPTYQIPDGVEIRQTIVAEGFAGDDSLLVRLERGARIDYVVVVRVADLVATLMYANGSEADARDMAATVEARMR